MIPLLSDFNHRKKILYGVGGIGLKGETTIEALAIGFDASEADDVAIGQVIANIGQVIQKVRIGRAQSRLLSVRCETE